MVLGSSVTAGNFMAQGTSADSLPVLSGSRCKECRSTGMLRLSDEFAVPGSLYDVQNLILYFGGHASTIAAPTDPYTLFNTLSAGRAIIMFVRTSPYSNHFIVIRGMTFNPDPVIFINYPMNYYIQPFSYYSLLQSWSAAIVVY